MTLNTKKVVPKDLIDSLLADYQKPEDLIGEKAALNRLSIEFKDRVPCQ